MNSIVTVFRLAVLPLVIAALVAIAVAPMGPTAAAISWRRFSRGRAAGCWCGSGTTSA